MQNSEAELNSRMGGRNDFETALGYGGDIKGGWVGAEMQDQQQPLNCE